MAAVTLLSVAVWLVLGGEPPQPALATAGPRIEAHFVRMIGTSP